MTFYRVSFCDDHGFINYEWFVKASDATACVRDLKEHESVTHFSDVVMDYHVIEDDKPEHLIDWLNKHFTKETV